MALTQADIVAKIAADKEISKAKAKLEWAYFCGLIKDYLDADEVVKLPEIGILRRRFKEEHLANTPGKTEKVTVPARYEYKLKSKRTLA